VCNSWQAEAPAPRLQSKVGQALPPANCSTQRLHGIDSHGTAGWDPASGENY